MGSRGSSWAGRSHTLGCDSGGWRRVCLLAVLSDLSGSGEQQRGLALLRSNHSKVCSNRSIPPVRTKLHAQDLQLNVGLVQAVSVPGWAGLGVGVGSRSSGLRSSSARTFHAAASPGAVRGGNARPGSGSCSLFPFTPSISFSPGGCFY